MFELYFDKIWRLLRIQGLPQFVADDAAQDVFVIAAKKINAIEFGKEKAFLIGTALRIAANRKRGHILSKVEVTDKLEQFSDEVSIPPSKSLEQRQSHELLYKIIEKIPDSMRQVFVLFEIEGMTMLEISECLKLPPGTVASRLRRGRKTFDAAVLRLRAKLGKQ